MKKLSLANLPTKIQKLERLSSELNMNVFIKRDDQTGSEWSGNKIRKLEFSVQEAQEMGCNVLITCGGIQSNHCRATVSVATYFGMRSAVLLRISEQPPVEGNYFLDLLMGADVKFCTKEEYGTRRGEIMEAMAENYRLKGLKPYIIPEGASNGIGTLGYYNAMNEIVEQEKELGITFDTIVVATGSGGTCSGLNLANIIKGYNKRIVSMAVCEDVDYFQNVALTISKEALSYLVKQNEISEQKKIELEKMLKKSDFEINDKYVGIGYALSRPEELEHIKRIARLEGVVFDPVYTGKATYGLKNELEKGGDLRTSKNILFIHTGGLFGLFPISDKFIF
ncbi:MAG: D-cysteine desulfhydrase family protein [Bacteroidales bacterium]|jgi:D-cysteine desulfhydrase